MDPRQKLFRKAALDKMASPERLDEMMRVTAPAGWLALAVLGLMLVAAGFWSVFGRIPIKVHGNGILIRGQAVLDVTSSTNGRVESIGVKTGDIVEAGGTVAVVGQPDLALQIENTREELEVLIAQTKTQGASTGQIIRQLQTQKDGLEKKAVLQEGALERGLVTGGQLLDTKGQIASIEQRIAQHRSELDARSNRVDEVRRELEQLEGRMAGSGEIVSPYAGRVLELMVDPGNLVSQGTRLLTLEALEGPVDAVLYFPAGDGKKIAAGMETRIAPATIKPEEYGFILGEVQATSTYPVTPEGMVRVLRNEQLARTLAGEAAQIEISADLFEDAETPSGFRWSSSQGPPGGVYSGTICTASVIVEMKRPISYVLPILREAFGVGT